MKRIILTTVAAFAIASPVLADTSPVASRIFAQIQAEKYAGTAHAYSLSAAHSASLSPEAIRILASIRAEKAGNQPPVVSLNAPQTTRARLIFDAIAAE